MASSRREAFTLIELLIVIAIIGLTATIAIAAIGGARAKSRDEKRATDLSQIRKALELSFEPGSGYPVAGTPIEIGTSATDVLCAKDGVTSFVPENTPANCDADRVFIGLVPGNPTPNGAPYMYRSTDEQGATCAAAPCLGYCIQTTLEKGLPQSGLAAGTVIIDPASMRNGTCP